MTCNPWDRDYTLGPFYDEDGTEILPCTTEATDELLAECMGYYRIAANASDLDGRSLLLCNRRLTTYIQDSWNEVMGKDESAGFLVAYHSAPKAVGRLVEDVLCRCLLEMVLPGHAGAATMLTVGDACRSGRLVQPAKGYRSDDLLVLTARDRGWLVESKASFSGPS